MSTAKYKTNFILILILALSSLCTPLSAQERRPGKLFPPEKIDILERPREWQDIDEIMYRMRIHNGDVVADIGAGSGYFTIPLARKVGTEGRVYAEDIQKEMTDYISQKVKKLHLKNIRIILGKVENPLIPNNSLNHAFIANTYHELERPLLLLNNIKKDLRSHGKLTIIDWDPTKDPTFGPPKEEKVPVDIVIKEAEKVGFKLMEKHDFMPYHYFLIFKYF
ncbi:MAG: class I SAM-dependent methyltransferase [Candidatus Scalinduaceae bacterium]